MKKNLLVTLSAILLFLLRLSAQTVITDTTAGASMWACPPGVTSVTVECWGAGGGGGFAKYQYTSAGSGGGGSYVNYTMPVTVGTTYYIYVGAGGIGGIDSVTPGAKGGASYFGSTTDTLAQNAIVLAVGGNGGNSIDSTGAKGAPDSTTGGAAMTTGNLPLTGFNSSLYGAAGGNSTSTGAKAGGAGANGGAGGSASTNFAASKKGYNGFTPGGGGSGAIDKSAKGGEAGGNGAVGEVQLTYVSAASVFKPTSFTANGVSATQIDLTAVSNANNNNIVVVYSTKNSFTPPVDGTPVGSAGSSFAGGTVFYHGLATNLPNQTGLLPGVTYFYEAICYDAANTFSPILKTSAQTFISNLINTDFTTTPANYFAGIANPAATITQSFAKGVLEHAYIVDTGFAIGTESDTTLAGLMPIDTSVAGASYSLKYAVANNWYVDYLITPNSGYSLNVSSISGSMALSGAASTNNFGVLYGVGTSTTPPSTFYNANSATKSVDSTGTTMSGTSVKFSSITASVTLNGTSNLTSSQVLYVRIVLYRAYPSSTLQTMFHSGLTIGGLATNALPVSISSFTGVVNNKTIKTNWHTASQLNTALFNVQNSKDGSIFKTIGTVNSLQSTTNSYQFIDFSPLFGTNYYRLQSVDKNGVISYSKTISVLYSANEFGIKLYPNPCKDNITIDESNLTLIKIIDNLGRIVKSVKNSSTQTVNVSSLKAGYYHLITQTNDGVIKNTIFIKE